MRCALKHTAHTQHVSNSYLYACGGFLLTSRAQTREQTQKITVRTRGAREPHVHVRTLNTHVHAHNTCKHTARVFCLVMDMARVV